MINKTRFLIRFGWILFRGPRRRRFVSLWFYIHRSEIKRLALFVWGSVLGVIAQYSVLIPLTLFTRVSAGLSLFVSFALNYNVKFFYHKYKVFHDREVDRFFLEWIGYMTIAYINTRLTNEIRYLYHLDFVHTQAYTIIPTTVTMYLLSKFVVFKGQKT